jgi:5-methylcytosine-specific restriction endonuclease McrA
MASMEMPRDDDKPVPRRPEEFPDRRWTEENWLRLIRELVERGLVDWKEVASLVLGQLNPPQVGTQVASKKSVQAYFPPRKTWQAVREWLYEQHGQCASCGTRVELQADHKIPRELGGTDELHNYQLLCRRCNVIRRPSHKKGGLTFLTAEAALMWLLFVYKPKTYEEFEALCRAYGLTMANIRFQEAWAMAIWLSRDGEYEMEE